MTGHCQQHVYLCGFNGFQQIDRATGGCHGSEGCCTQPVKYTCTQNTSADVPTKVWFNWSQIWIWKESGHIDVFGLNQEEVGLALVKENINPQSVVSYYNTTIIQAQHRDKKDDRSISILTENGSIKPLSGHSSQVKIVDATSTHIAALKDCHLLSGTLSDVPESPVLMLTDLNFDKQVQTVACGFDHTLILTNCGQVYSMGSSSRGQLGHGDTSVDVVNTPTLIQALHGLHMVTIAAGGWHSAAVSDSGDLYVWGWNESGQLGLPNGSIDSRSYDTTGQCDTDRSCDEINRSCDQDSSSSVDLRCVTPHGVVVSLQQDIDPVLIQSVPYGLDIPDDAQVTTVVCGSRHTCVLFDNGYLMTTGWNKYGQLGHGDTESVDRLKTVMSLAQKHEKVIGVFAKQWNTAILTQSRNLGNSSDVT